MKYLFQFALIASISFAGEILNGILPLPVPASIYGLLILFGGLSTKIIKLEHVEETANFLLSVMPVMFVPPAVSLMTKWDVLKDNLAGLLVTCVLSTVLVMGVTGKIAQILIICKEKKRNG